MFVFVAQILAIIIFFSVPDANNTGGLGVTINSIWTWMIPICLGWVWVGSQTSHSGVRDALKDASQNVTGQPVSGIRDRTGDERRAIYATGEGVELHALVGNLPANHGEEALEAHALMGDPPAAVSRQWLTADVAGDAIEPGPIHNYARLWTHMAVARDVVNAFKFMNLRLEGRQIVKLSVRGEPWNNEDHDANLVGEPQQMAAFIGLERNGEEMQLYSMKPPPGAMTRVLLAAFVSLFVQWGTTGSAMVIAY
jgi:hypothetical protein